MRYVYFSLNVQNSLNSCFFHILRVLFSLRIRPYVDRSVSYEVETKMRDEISISFIDSSIDDENIINIWPKFITLFS